MRNVTNATLGRAAAGPRGACVMPGVHGRHGDETGVDGAVEREGGTDAHTRALAEPTAACTAHERAHLHFHAVALHAGGDGSDARASFHLRVIAWGARGTIGDSAASSHTMAANA
jgi:hypothetical protein